MNDGNHHGVGGLLRRIGWRSHPRRVAPLLGVIACATLGLGLASPVAGASTGAATPSGPGLSAVSTFVTADAAISGALTSAPADHQLRGRTAPLPHTTGPNCTFNGATVLVENVTPGSAISVSCSGWGSNDAVSAAEFSPLILNSGSTDEIDPNLQNFTSDSAGNLTGTFVVPNPFSAPDPAAVCPPTAAQTAQGYVRCGVALADQAGNGSAVALNYLVPPPPPGTPAVGMAATPDGQGYWVAWSNGDVTVHGDAPSYGNASTFNLAQPITHIVSTPDGGGYWLVAADGGTFAFGTAGFYGSMGAAHLNKPVVDMAPTSDGQGYWLVASDGGIFAFGDAVFRGSMGGLPLNKPIVGIAADNATGGYWLVASDGGIFAIGAPFFGSTGALALNKPVNGMAATPSDRGYLFVASDGGIFAFGNAAFHGSTGGLTLNKPIVGMSIDPATGGYWLVGSDGGIFAFGAPFFGAA